jgi:hypothetical protein
MKTQTKTAKHASLFKKKMNEKVIDDDNEKSNLCV